MSKSASTRGFSEKWSASASEKRKGAGNVNYVPINQDNLRSLISEGFSVKNIAEILQINYTTIYDKMNEFWGITSIKEMRKKLGVKVRKDVHPQYIKVDKSRLKNLILENYNSEQIAEIMDLTVTTVWRKIEEFWGVSLRELQKRWGLKTHIQKLGERSTCKINIPKRDLEKFIKKGYKIIDIAAYYNVHRTTIADRIIKYWGMNFTDLKKNGTFSLAFYRFRS